MNETQTVNSLDTTDESNEDILQLVCFKLGDEEYAVDITVVQEIIRIQRITAIPQMPDFVLGVINIRGQIIPILDLRKRFQLPIKEFDASSKMIVADVKGVIIGIVVDEILDNVRMQRSAVNPSPMVKNAIDPDCIKGLGDLENRMIIILDLHKVSNLINEDIKLFDIAVS